MKKLLYISAAILGLLSISCKKIEPLSDAPFMMNLTRIQARSIWVDIIPENNDFYYYYDVVSEEDYKSYGSDENLVIMVDKILHTLYDFAMEFSEDKISFQELCLYRDAIYEAYYGNRNKLKPEQTYYLFAYSYDSSGKPVQNLVKLKFTTPKEVISDISFKISLEGSSVTVTPSNDKEFYLCDYNSASDIKLSYLNSPSYYYEQALSVYETYGFIDAMLQKGKYTEDMTDYLILNPGDIVYLGIAGYNVSDSGLTYFRIFA